ncbi:c-type cytochrome [Sphingomonas lycopersici]|uniref:c-type cytochrome n=1 Tax=Sphingomonas lycopersici TaxID=2951807 RepID=UPI002238B236|nr:cytochrome c [Sphingomonas lycopersici]
MRPPLRPIVAGWFLGVMTCGVVALLVAALFLSGIAFRVGADQPHSKLLAWAIHRTMLSSVRRHARREVPRLPLDRATLLAGAALYEQRCIACHGGPGIARAYWVSAMLPTPPYLVDASARWSHAELYALIHDGVKMTGMPAWGEISSDREIAQIVALIEAMPMMTPDQFAQLRRAAAARRR